MAFDRRTSLIGKAIGAIAILYLSSLAVSYSLVESSEIELRRSGKSPQINYLCVLNPIRFLQENVSIIQEGRRLRAQSAEPLSKLGYSPLG